VNERARQTEPGGKSSEISRFIHRPLHNTIGGIAAPTAFAHATTVTLSPCSEPVMCTVRAPFLANTSLRLFV
jgi:hypothetical protein